MKVIIFIVLCLVGASYQGVLVSWEDVDVTEQIVRTLVQNAIEYHNSVVNFSSYYENLVEIKSARQQVYANGVNYEIICIIGETHCAKQDAGASLCPVEDNSPKKRCIYTIWKDSTGQRGDIRAIKCDIV